MTRYLLRTVEGDPRARLRIAPGVLEVDPDGRVDDAVVDVIRSVGAGIPYRGARTRPGLWGPVHERILFDVHPGDEDFPAALLALLARHPRTRAEAWVIEPSEGG